MNKKKCQKLVKIAQNRLKKGPKTRNTDIFFRYAGVVDDIKPCRCNAKTGTIIQTLFGQLWGLKSVLTGRDLTWQGQFMASINCGLCNWRWMGCKERNMTFTLWNHVYISDLVKNISGDVSMWKLLLVVNYFVLHNGWVSYVKNCACPEILAYNYPNIWSF